VDDAANDRREARDDVRVIAEARHETSLAREAPPGWVRSVSGRRAPERPGVGHVEGHVVEERGRHDREIALGEALAERTEALVCSHPTGYSVPMR
jgi:hypothetical protein